VCVLKPDRLSITRIEMFQKNLVVDGKSVVIALSQLHSPTKKKCGKWCRNNTTPRPSWRYSSEDEGNGGKEQR